MVAGRNICDGIQSVMFINIKLNAVLSQLAVLEVTVIIQQPTERENENFDASEPYLSVLNRNSIDYNVCPSDVT